MALGISVQDLARSLLAATGADAGPQMAARWINERYIEFVGRARTHQLQHNASVFVPAPITAGTVSVTQGSASVVGTNTSFSNTNIGWSFRANITWYVVVGVSGQTLTLDSVYSEDSNTAASYNLVQRYIPIDPGARWVSHVAHMRTRRLLNALTTSEMQANYPSRQIVGGFPSVWSEAARFVTADFDISTTLGQTGQKLIEVYPPSTTPETYYYTYWRVPKTLALTDTLPPEVDEYVIREGVLVDIYRWKSEKAANKAIETGNAQFLQIAEYYANKESRQRTIWEQTIQEGLVADAAWHPEISICIDTWPKAPIWDRDIETAHDWIVSTWPE